MKDTVSVAVPPQRGNPLPLTEGNPHEAKLQRACKSTAEEKQLQHLTTMALLAGDEAEADRLSALLARQQAARIGGAARRLLPKAQRWERSRRAAAPRPGPRAPRQRAGRAPRRSSAPKPSAPNAGNKDSPPAPPEPPRSRAGQQVGAPVLISDASAFAVVGLTPRQLRTLVRAKGLHSVKVGRRTLVRADALLRALGLDGEPASAPAPEPAWSPAHLLRAIRGGKAGAR